MTIKKPLLHLRKLLDELLHHKKNVTKASPEATPKPSVSLAQELNPTLDPYSPPVLKRKKPSSSGS